MTDLTDRAADLGRERGHALATWVFDGNTNADVYETFKRWDEDGDPRLDEFGPRAGWLSGEDSDDLTPTSLAYELDLDPEQVTDADGDEICEAYESAADEAYWTELRRVVAIQTA